LPRTRRRDHRYRRRSSWFAIASIGCSLALSARTVTPVDVVIAAGAFALVGWGLYRALLEGEPLSARA
jgi:hypothetical protein